ncbi:uncharacterized protein LOC144252904 [Urocitellus parryii]
MGRLHASRCSFTFTAWRRCPAARACARAAAARLLRQREWPGAGRQGGGAVGPEACGAAGPESPLAEREPRRAWRAGRVCQGTPASPQRRARCAASGGPERRRRPQKVKGQGRVFWVSKSGGRARLLRWRESGGRARGGGAAARRRGGLEARGRKRLPLPGTPAEPGGRGPRARAFTFCGLLLRSGRRPRLLHQRESGLCAMDNFTDGDFTVADYALLEDSPFEDDCVFAPEYKTDDYVRVTQL